MAIRPLNSIAGFSTGDPAITVIQANADITTINLTANGISNLGNVGNVKITGGNVGEYLSTDGAGNLSWDSIGNISSNRAAVMPYLIPTGESYIVNENFQGLYSQAITIDGELEVDGILIEVPISFDAAPTQILFADNGNPTGRSGFTIDPISGNVELPSKVTVAGNILPSSDDTYDLGSPSKKWRNGYFGGNTLYLDNASIAVDANGYVVITNTLGGQFIVEGNTTGGTNEIENGNSNVSVYANGNIAMTVAGTANIMVVTTAGANLTGNLTTGGIKTDNLYYANGNPWDLSDPGGSNTQIQFNDDESFGGSAAFTFNKTSNVVTVSGNLSVGNVSGANVISANYLVSNSGCVSINGAVLAYDNASGAAGVFSSLATDINFGLAANITAGSTTGTTTIRGNLVVDNNVWANTGTVKGSLLTGTLTTASQPNITSVGSLTNLTVTGNVSANNATANTVTTNSTISKRSNIAVTTDTVIDSFSATAYRTAKYVIKSKNDDGYESLEVLLIHNNINSYVTVYAAINDGGGNTVAITTGISSGNVELRATGLNTNTVVNLIGTYVPD